MVNITHTKNIIDIKNKLSIVRKTINEPIDTITVENQSRGYWNDKYIETNLSKHHC